MSKFTKQEAISALNKALLPSSASIHNPGELSELVSLVHTLLGPGWNLNRYRTVSFTGTIGVTSVQSDLVPQGKYRHVLSAHGVHLAGPNTFAAGLVIFDNVTTIDSYLDFTGTHPAGAAVINGFPASYVGVCVVSPRPFYVPPGHGVAVNQNVADAATQLMLRYTFADFDLGEPCWPA